MVERLRKEDWVAWVIAYTKGKRITELIVERELKVSLFVLVARKLCFLMVGWNAKGELFCNKGIGRELSLVDAIGILDYMAARGNGEWLGGDKSKFLVLYRSYAEWAKLLYDWVDSTGQMGNVFTLYELLEGDDTKGVLNCCCCCCCLPISYI